MNKIIILYLILMFFGRSLLNNLTCNEVMEMPMENKKLTFGELTSMQPKDIVDCLSHISEEPLLTTEARFIWKSLASFYEGVANIPQSVLAELNWVTVAITDEEYENISIATIDTVRNFGLPYNLDMAQLEKIAERVRQDFAGKTPEDYTYYDLRALNQILCAFNTSEIERIHPSAYKEAAYFIGKLNCSSEVMTSFANLAVKKHAFGPVVEWTPLIIKILGNVASYVPGGVPGYLNVKLNAEDNLAYKFLELQLEEKKFSYA